MATLAWMTLQADKCPGCGGWLSETTHPDNEEAWEGKTVRCHKCRARNVVAKKMEGVGDPASLLMYAEKEPEDG